MLGMDEWMQMPTVCRFHRIVAATAVVVQTKRLSNEAVCVYVCCRECVGSC